MFSAPFQRPFWDQLNFFSISPPSARVQPEPHKQPLWQQLVKKCLQCCACAHTLVSEKLEIFIIQLVGQLSPPRPGDQSSTRCIYHSDSWGTTALRLIGMFQALTAIFYRSKFSHSWKGSESILWKDWQIFYCNIDMTWLQTQPMHINNLIKSQKSIQYTINWIE